MDDINPALPIIRKIPQFPSFQGPEGNAGFSTINRSLGGSEKSQDPEGRVCVAPQISW